MLLERILSTAQPLAFLISFSPLLPAATLEDLTYTDSGGAITITRCSQTASGTLEIPPMIDGKPVTAIGDFAFSRCQFLTRVTIPNGVTRLGDQSFSQCYRLTGMSIPASVETIGREAFFYCDGLTRLTFGHGLAVIGESAFSYCTGLKSLTIPASVTRIETYAFLTCSNLKSVTFLGNAPFTGTGVFNEAPARIQIQFHDGKKGFSSPTWRGYPSIRLSPEITVQQPRGTGIASRSVRNLSKTRAVKTFSLKNDGEIPLVGLAITKSGSHAKDFIVTAPTVATLAPGASTTFKISFQPTAKGLRKAGIRIKSNDGDENPFIISLSGRGN